MATGLANTVRVNPKILIRCFLTNPAHGMKQCRFHHRFRNSGLSAACSIEPDDVPQSSPQNQFRRTLFQLPKLPNPLKLPSKDMIFSYTEIKIVGYSMEQMFDIVSDVNDYESFLPWCKKSTVLSQNSGNIVAAIVVGFPPITERYTSHVTLIRPRAIKAEAADGRIFKHMLSVWKFEPGLANNSRTCTLNFHISFQFRSALHSAVANVFFDEVAKSMATAFLRRAENIHGKGSIDCQEVYQCS